MKRTILFTMVFAFGTAADIAYADFTFGEPTNLGPIVNSSYNDASPDISADGLSLFFQSERPGGSGEWDLWMARREKKDDDWGTPVNLGLTVNSSTSDQTPHISGDSLSLYFFSIRPGGSGWADLWVTTRATTADDWDNAVNLGPMVNSATLDSDPSISADGLELYFCSDRPGGSGGADLWVVTRSTIDDDWGTPVNLGPIINTSFVDTHPRISADGLALFFASDRPRGYGSWDLYVTTRLTVTEPWGTPVNLGPMVNTAYGDSAPGISPDGLSLYFSDYPLPRPGGHGDLDIWRVSIEPVVDLNGDGIVDAADMCIIVDHWGTDEPLCDIGPMPWGDGIVDVQDLIVLAEHLFEGIPPVEPEEVNVNEDDDGSQVELEQGQILVITLESNPTTGYSWEVVETQASILEQMGEAEFKQSETGEPPLVGAGGWEIFRFKAVSAGQMTLKLGYQRPWEEGVAPLKSFSIQVVVR